MFKLYHWKSLVMRNTFAKYESLTFLDTPNMTMFKFFKSRSKVTFKVTHSNLCYCRKGLVKRNTHAKYECPISENIKVMTMVITRHVFGKHGCPRRQQSQNMAKISKSYILTPPHPQGQVMSVKCEEHIDELTVQVW